MTAPTSEALAAVMTQALGQVVSIHELAPVTAGARRINVLFDAKVDGTRQGFCLTQQPNSGDAFSQSIMSEVQWLKSAAAGGVSVAEVVAASDDSELMGGSFFISRKIEGVTIPKHVVGICSANAGLGAKVAYQIGQSLARLHQTSVEEVPASPPAIPSPAGARTSPVESALDWGRSEVSTLLQRSPALELTVRWLDRNQPGHLSAVPIHGDVRNGNIIVNSDGLGAILDWETAHLGDPFEDLAWLAQRMWRARHDHLEIGGFANRSDLRGGYESAGGEWDEERFHWWKVFRTLWWGVGLARQAEQHLNGTFRSIVMAASGRRVAELEWDALCLIEGR